MIVKLDAVAERITGNVDRFNTDLEYYVGGEHYENGAIAIYDKGILKSEKGSLLGFKFHFPFKKGDTLFMARNPHLKKAGMVTYDGICSDASYILRTKDPAILLPEYLPLIIQSDKLWAFFEANKSGSVNYLMNWKELRNYEFDLPSIDIQQKISKIVWAAEETRRLYEQMIAATDEYVKSQFIEVIQPLLDAGKTIPLDELVEDDRPITYGILKPGSGFPGGVPVVKVKDMQNGIIDQSDLLLTTPELDYQYRRSRLRAGDLLISIRGSVGRMAEVPSNLENANITQDTARLSIKPDYNKVYVRGVLESQPMQRDMEKNIRGVAVKGINIGYLRALGIPMCDRAKQDELASLYIQTDKSKSELSQARDRANQIIHSFINNELA